jgi:hypothetical protein
MSSFSLKEDHPKETTMMKFLVCAEGCTSEEKFLLMDFAKEMPCEKSSPSLIDSNTDIKSALFSSEISKLSEFALGATSREESTESLG